VVGPSYSTVRLQRLQGRLNGAFPDPRVEFQLDTKAQEGAFRRSFDAVLKS
jgi:hypothetical protein